MLETLWSERLIFSYFPKGVLVGHWRKGVLLLPVLSLINLISPPFRSGTCLEHWFSSE